MDIYLTNHANVRNTRFYNADGQVLYKSETPGSAFSLHKKTTISKIIPNDSPDDMSDRFAEIATIEWHPVGSRLTYGGTTVTISEFMPIKGILKHHRVFTAPGDGRSFKWHLGVHHSTLALNDDSKTPVVGRHGGNSRLIGQARLARLEIFPGFEHLVDIFLITYIYVEKKRKDR
ncbi:hypothetical protein PILCRDRAFT_550834 [Piloderma croceum F 1598]|uniref:DUF6593 domain-containing protein n=1 Tax=Piloderma croceum (strain F 1598) TaxID=765440 RepID=A0A0C3F4M3_PILCF|nr:hypothetical protein PILCRDRAFT_550834 [Piloderma croceum F 1598]